jgi:hypothetical protein
MSSDNPTFAEIAEENIRQYREKPSLTKEELDELYTPYEVDIDD